MSGGPHWITYTPLKFRKLGRTGSVGMKVNPNLRKWIARAKRYSLFFVALSAIAGALWQWATTNQLEKRKHESTLIARALEDKDKRVVAANLRVLLDLKLVRENRRLRDYADHPEKIPGFAGAAIRDRLVSIGEIKRILKEHGEYSGNTFEDKDDGDYRLAIARFQAHHGLPADGLLGPDTLAKLIISYPKEFGVQ